MDNHKSKGGGTSTSVDTEAIRRAFRVLMSVVAPMPVLATIAKVANGEPVGPAVMAIFLGTIPASCAVGYAIRKRPSALEELTVYLYINIPMNIGQPIFTLLNPQSNMEDVVRDTIGGFVIMQFLAVLRLFLQMRGATVSLPFRCQIMEAPVFLFLGFVRAGFDPAVRWAVPTWICLAIFITIVTMAFCYNTEALLEERTSLKEAQSKLQKVLDAQRSMWNSIFDGSCMCNSDGCITEASPHLQHMLSGGAVGSSIVGQNLASFVEEPHERGRLADFMQQAVRRASKQAMTIQTTLGVRQTLDGDASGGSMPPHTHQCLEVKLFGSAVLCGTTPVGQSDDGEHDGAAACSPEGGLLIGLQLVSGGIDHRPSEPKAPRSNAGSKQKTRAPSTSHGGVDVPLAETMSIPFEAGSDKYTVKGPPPQSYLLDWVPSKFVERFKSWIRHEVQEAPGDVPTKTAPISGVYLKPPVFQSAGLYAHRALLEVFPPEEDHKGVVALPTVLHLEEVRVLSVEPRVPFDIRLVNTRHLDKVEEVDEEDDLEEVETSSMPRLTSTGSDSDDCGDTLISGADIFPHDSISEGGFRHRLAALNDNSHDR